MSEGIRKAFTRGHLASHFVYESYDETSGFFFNRGSIGFVLKGWPLVGTNLQAQGEVGEFLKEEENLPGGASLQVMMVGSRKITPFLDHWQKLRQGDMFQTLAQKRTEFLEREACEKGTIKDVNLYISLTVPSFDMSASLKMDMERRREVLKSTLKAIGLWVEDVSDMDLISLLRELFGWEETARSSLNPHDLLSEQILPGDFSLEVKSEGLKLMGSQEKAFIALECIKRPSNWKLALMDLFLGDEMRRGEQIKSDFILSFGLEVLPLQSLEKAKAISKRETLMKNLKSGLLKWLPGLEEEYEDITAAVTDIQGGDRIVALYQHVLLMDDISRIKESVFSFRAQMRRLGFHYVPTEHDHLAVMLSLLPMQLVESEKGKWKKKTNGLGPTLRKLGRGTKTISSEAKVLLPIVGEWKGDLRSPGMILSGRRGQIMYWSPFGPVLVPQAGKTPQSNENFNLCIAGVPGSGKSVFMQELMLSTLGVGGRVFVLDYGRSFKRTCQILKGTYIEFDLKKPISLNPFSTISEIEEDFEAREDALSGIAAVLGTMAAPLAGTTDLQNAMLQKALRAIWQKKGNKSEITDIANWLLDREETYAKDLGNMLFPFTKDGIYGLFFKGKAEVELTAPIVVIETDHLRNVPALLTVIVQMMIVHINQTMVKGDRTHPFLIMIDEAWKLLQGKSSGAFIEEVGRIARKYKGSITLATQQLTDYFRAESPAAEKAFENAAWKAILKQNPETLLALRSNPKLAAFVKEDWQLERMQSIHSHPPHYSEVALFGPDVRGVVGRLRLDPFTLLLTSTNAEDFQLLEDLTKEGLAPQEAIEQVLKMRGREGHT